MFDRTRALVAVVAVMLAGAVAALAGDLDPAFGTGGVVRTDIGGWDNVSDVLVQPDGGILVAGTIDWNGTRNPFLVRYHSDGAPDTAFGDAGRVVLDRYTQPPPRIALQPDGKILLATRSDDAPAGLLVLRFRTDGTPDLEFGSDGAALMPSMIVSSIAGVGIAPGGGILVGARLSGLAGEAVGIARLTAAGAPEPGFGEGGLVTVELAFPMLPLAFAVDASGRSVAGGFTFGLPGRFFTDAFVARFDANGSLDLSFGESGIVLIQQPDNGTEIQALSIQDDGKVVAGGRAWGPAYNESRWLLARFDEDGSPDASFGSEGSVELDPSTGHDVILGIAINEAGIHVAGQTETLEKGLAAARFLSNGSLDAGFGPGGIAGVPGLAATGFNRIAVQPDAKVVVAGSGLVFDPEFAVDSYVARYSGDSLPDTTPPTLTVPQGVVADATGPNGATVAFDVTATDDFGPVATLSCAPASGSLFAIGDTVVGCLAVDHAGNSQTASFVVRVKGAAEQLADLRHAVTGVGPGKSLVEKVKQAEAQIARGDVAATVRTLRAFVNEVKAQSGKKVPPDLATDLIADATRIAAVLGQLL
jgi:uncharacterized delta-60 repeat protein